MANNRMSLECRECGEHFYFAKYYPSTGWYAAGEMHNDEYGVLNLNRWFEAHRHATGDVIQPAAKPAWSNLFEPGRRYGSLFGAHIALAYSDGPASPIGSFLTTLQEKLSEPGLDTPPPPVV